MGLPQKPQGHWNAPGPNIPAIFTMKGADSTAVSHVFAELGMGLFIRKECTPEPGTPPRKRHRSPDWKALTP